MNQTGKFYQNEIARIQKRIRELQKRLKSEDTRGIARQAAKREILLLQEDLAQNRRSLKLCAKD